MKLTRVITKLTLLAFCSQTVLLTGCVGASNNPSDNHESHQASTNVTISNDDINQQIWANIIGNEATTINSSLGILMTNRSGYTLTKIGCDNPDNYSDHLANTISNGMLPTMTANFDRVKWEQMREYPEIYNPAHVYDNSLQNFHNLAVNQAVNCYYSAYIPQADKSMYLKLVFKNKQIATSGANGHYQPREDLRNIAHWMAVGGSFAFPAGYIIAKVIGGYATGSLTRAQIVVGFGALGVSGLGMLSLVGSLGVEISSWIIDAKNKNIGDSTTQLIMANLDVPSVRDTLSWNSTHDNQHQIAANAQVNTIDFSQNTAQLTKTFTFASGQGTDTNLGVALTLGSITTPWTRQASDDDPFIGKDVTSSKRGDAILALEISQITQADDKKDTAHQKLLQAFNNNGLPNLSVDTNFSAPSYQLMSIVDTKHKVGLYNNNTNKLGLKSGLSKVAFESGLDGIVLNHSEEVNLQVTIPQDSISAKLKGAENSAQFGKGLDVNYIAQEDSGADNSYVQVKSLALKAKYDQDSSSHKYIFSMIDGAYPPKVGQAYPLKLAIGGANDGKKHLGHIYIADAVSKTTVIPVYLNYNLISEPQTQTITQGDNSIVRITVKNASTDDYQQISVSGVPPEKAQLLTDNLDGLPNCNNGLKHGKVCELSYDASNLDPGSYQFTIYGVTDKANAHNVPPIDNANVGSFNLLVNGGF